MSVLLETYTRRAANSCYDRTSLITVFVVCFLGVIITPKKIAVIFSPSVSATNYKASYELMSVVCVVVYEQYLYVASRLRGKFAAVL